MRRGRRAPWWMRHLVFAILVFSSCFARCAHAGWLKDTCDNLLNRVTMDDPYDYEFYSRTWLERQAARLEIKRAWAKLTKQEREELDNIHRELQIREQFPHIYNKESGK